MLAKAVILADEATGQVLFERNAGAARAMASTTKVMTALLALERLDERKVVTIGAGPPQVGEESLRLQKGERLTVRQLLLGLLLKSANDAGVALAEAVDGSEAAFVRRMNRKATALRLGATHYVTPYGLDRPGHQTSARDLARLWEVAMRRADFRSLVATRSARISGGPLSLRRFVSTNQLLGSYRWTVGGKTGFTNRAGRCLVASASRGGRRLVAVALGSPNAFADVQALFEHGFSKFVRVRLAEPRPAGVGRPRSTGRAPDHHRRRRPGPPGPARPGPPDPPPGFVGRSRGRGGPVHERGAAAGPGRPGSASRDRADPDLDGRPDPHQRRLRTGGGRRAGGGRLGRGARRRRPSPRERSCAWARCPPGLRRPRSTRSSGAPLHDLHRRAHPPTAGGAGRRGTTRGPGRRGTDPGTAGGAVAGGPGGRAGAGGGAGGRAAGRLPGG